MNKIDVLDMLKEGVVEVKFTKTDGSARTMKATLQAELVSGGNVEKATSVVRANESVQAVWDTVASGWRSFKWSTITSVNDISTPDGISVK